MVFKPWQYHTIAFQKEDLIETEEVDIHGCQSSTISGKLIRETMLN